VTKTADFLVQNVRVVNDSRDSELRHKEVFESIEALMKQAARSDGIELSYGQGFLRPIDLHDDEFVLTEDYDRTDTSYVDIYVKVRFDRDKDAKAQINALRKFIMDAENVGRTEIDMEGDIGLSIVRPERYRYEIIAGIAEESRKLMEAMGGNCAVSVDGLEGRVQWERSSLSELTLFIPYTVSVTGCTR
jgi:hypothetical protein